MGSKETRASGEFEERKKGFEEGGVGLMLF